VWRAGKDALPAIRDNHSTKGLLAAAGAGAGITWGLSKLDKRRRHVAVDRAAAAVRGVRTKALGKADYTAGKARGPVHAVASLMRSEREYDDTTLARKVESEIFRPPDSPKGRVSVNVAQGVVELRGEVSNPSQIQELGSAARQVEGVRDVRNLLHTAA
jgi:osmotically-inducible protein OsmY